MTAGLKRLVEEAELYADQLKQEEEIRVAVTLTDTGEEATILLGDSLSVSEGSESPDLRLTLESQTFENVLEGEADFGALIGRSRASDVRPINFQILNPEKAATTVETMKAMMTYFFTPGKVKAKRLLRDLAGEAHGARPIPLVYHEGVRFAWYSIGEGEVLNEAGERDPYPQFVAISKGRGRLILEDEEIPLKPNIGVYIPADSLHKIEAQEDIEAFWLAWKAPPM